MLTCYRRQHCRRCCLFSHVVDATTQKERNTTSFLHIRPYMTIRLYNMTLRLLGWYIYIPLVIYIVPLVKWQNCKQAVNGRTACSCTQILISANSHTAYLCRNAVSRVGGLMLHGSSHQPASETSTHFICCLLPLPVHMILRHVICLT